MYEPLIYTVLNCLGFLFFLFVWNHIPKVGFLGIWRFIHPKPYDYTTIPGLKLEVQPSRLPPLSIEPEEQLIDISTVRGHMEEIRKFLNYRQFFEFLNLCFGPLNSFYWGPRFVVTVANEKMVKILAENRDQLLSVCPLAIGSVIAGFPRYSTTKLYSEIEDQVCKPAPKIDATLREKKQDKIFNHGVAEVTKEAASEKDIVDFIQQVPLIYEEELNTKKSIREILSRPLVVMFNEEIDVDAHPVPRLVPIIIHTGGLVQAWETRTIYSSFMAAMDWVPGVKLLSRFDQQIHMKIKKEVK